MTWKFPVMFASVGVGDEDTKFARIRSASASPGSVASMATTGSVCTARCAKVHEVGIQTWPDRHGSGPQAGAVWTAPFPTTVRISNGAGLAIRQRQRKRAAPGTIGCRADVRPSSVPLPLRSTNMVALATPASPVSRVPLPFWSLNNTP